jgi:hypothetical protein
MNQAGYSPRSLSDKLGIKPEMSLVILNAPNGYLSLLNIDALSDVIINSTVENNQTYNIIQYFVSQQHALENLFPRLLKHIAKDGMIWISWPKGSSKVETGLNENIIRDIGLHNGMVDVKVIAIDDTWSGLKFVYRLKDRV